MSYANSTYHTIKYNDNNQMSNWMVRMFINKAPNGLNNLTGIKIRTLRTELGISQRELADRLQLVDLDVDKNAIQRIEAGKRFVTDIELVSIAKALNVSITDLF